MKKTDDPIVVKQHFSASANEVWHAVTHRDAMVQWFFKQIESFEPREGFETRFTVTNEGRVFPHHLKITEVVPCEKLTFNWKYKGFPGDSFVTLAIREKSHGCELVLTHRITEDFPDHVPEFSRESCAGGWEWFIQKNLKGYLEEMHPPSK
mgnify:CR=1 FL=1